MKLRWLVLVSSIFSAAFVACSEDDAAPDDVAEDAGGRRDRAAPGDDDDDRDGGRDGGRDSSRSDDAAPTSKIVFVTSETYSGMLGGLAGADAKCAARASAAGLGGTFRAWLSDAADDASARLEPFAGEYVRVDGALVANDFADLTSGNIRSPIEIDEEGAKVTRDTIVWTNTLTSGAKSASHCTSWTVASDGERGHYGDLRYKDARWTTAATGACSPPGRLYCVEQ